VEPRGIEADISASGSHSVSRDSRGSGAVLQAAILFPLEGAGSIGPVVKMGVHDLSGARTEFHQQGDTPSLFLHENQTVNASRFTASAGVAIILPPQFLGNYFQW